ncbi:hypothetical protein J7E99_20660 [Streptomyces sp. ISL-44]|uniref:hypothetical protein n=1 Tax=Streptomyces sp. ISL-44 TaxID=2819184 RepID=UPI001BE5D1C2|nr:hypothetical protein [Streptomyces sp. ISL-44]MBT2543056.1 hypothetical protein [Streptomyces sp. ISL-44]
MPISALHRERLERALQGHEAGLSNAGPERAKVHTALLALGRNQDLLALIDDFLDSTEVVQVLRADGASVLRARGITLPEGVTMRVVDGSDSLPPVLRFQFTVRSLTVFADWDPATGGSARACA